MAKPKSADSIIRNLKKEKKQFEPKVPIVTEMFLPNNSGDHQKSIKTNAPINPEDIVNKKYVDDEIIDQAWLQATNQIGLTGNKTGSFSLITTGNCAFGNVEPFDDDTYYLGHPSWRWKSLYLSEDAFIGGTIDLGTNTITDGNLTGNWNFNDANLSNVHTIEVQDKASIGETQALGGNPPIGGMSTIIQGQRGGDHTGPFGRGGDGGDLDLLGGDAGSSIAFPPGTAGNAKFGGGKDRAMGANDGFAEITTQSLFVNEGSGFPKGVCYGDHINWTLGNAVQNQWYRISDVDMVSGVLLNVTHDGSGRLTFPKPGIYRVHGDITLEVNAAHVHIETGFDINGSGTPDASSIMHSTSKFSNQEQHHGWETLLDITTANHTVDVMIRTTDTGTPAFKVDNLRITAVQEGGT